VPINADGDLVRAREQGRVLAGQLGFTQGDLTLVATAISELARNIVRYARRGEIVLRRAEDGGVPGIVIIARDEGPGIPDVDRAIPPLAVSDWACRAFGGSWTSLKSSPRSAAGLSSRSRNGNVRQAHR